MGILFTNLLANVVAWITGSYVTDGLDGCECVVASTRPLMFGRFGRLLVNAKSRTLPQVKAGGCSQYCQGYTIYHKGVHHCDDHISMPREWINAVPVACLTPQLVVGYDLSYLLANVTMCFNYVLSKIRCRRQQRRATRPASFPGPRSDGTPTADVGHGVTTILKPPRQGSVYADDDDMVTIDGFTYRHLVQDVTNFKTMLLKLKRVIQEVDEAQYKLEIDSAELICLARRQLCTENPILPKDEFHGQNWKNGFKLSSSQPTSPYDDSNKYSFAAYLERDEHIQNNSNTDDVIKENSELKLQLQGIRHQVEEQERTIMLLQQQMTKYECGYSEPGGKAYSHVATQTDKQVSGFYKAGSYRSACVRRSSSTSSQPLSRYGNRTEFREISRNSITDEVFMDLESCDNDDDLDLLMEEVSLGSVCLSSVGDNFSQCGERSMSVASNHPGSVSRRSSFAARDQPYFYQQDSSHRDGPANHDIVNILCRKDPETYPGLEASDTFTVEHAKPQNGKCKIHFCETKAMQYQDSETGDCEDTVFMSSPKHPKTSTDETDENTDIGGKNTSAEYDGIPSANGSSSFSVHHRQSLSGQSDCSAQSHKADSFLTQEKEGCSFNWLSATDSVSELGYQSAASIAQLDDEVSELGDGRSTTSEQQQAAENNNTVLVMSESDDKKHSADKVQHVLKKQQCLQEPEDNVAIKSAGQSEQEPKKSARSLKFPSGRITKWSNPKPSIKPPPRPIQPPTKLDIMKQSQSVDSIRFGLPSQSSATIAEGPVEGAISEQAQRAGVLVGGAKKHRQLPSLTSVQHLTTNLGEPRASRLPRMASAGNVGAVHPGNHSRYQPILRGRAK
ncbi:hypothetical protein LSH36_317g03070 [Paralvinella palmiformis]|uniref:Uncharacterized protein n=1 Tax=Paralvinella palmiformis TaxID=53620 RepID=A0AAD9N296_9ANNE|nr:hypothetical protein LSH36_317g03070 [Paralvinella palmiformis]